MRSEDKILKDISKTLELHRTSRAGFTPEEEQKSKEKIKALRTELNSVITEGAVSCPACGLPPIGIHQPGSAIRSSFYEIGCRGQDKNPEDNSQHLRAIGISRKNAIDNWNEGEYWLKPQIA